MSETIRDTDYLEHMLQAIVRINRYVEDGGELEFLQNEKTQDAVIRKLEIIGEAASRLSSAFVAQHPEISWKDIAGMRHRLIHGYFKVNLETVWNVVEHDLGELEQQIRRLLKKQV